MPDELVTLGHVFEDEDDVMDYAAENRRLRLALAAAQEAQARTERDLRSAQASIVVLRKQLTPLYRALQAVFGEIDAAGVTPDQPEVVASSQAPRVSALWEEWKVKLGVGSSASRMIDALLVHGELSVAQLIVAMKAAKQTVYDAASRLNRVGLINKNGGKYSLKKL